MTRAEASKLAQYLDSIFAPVLLAKLVRRAEVRLEYSPLTLPEIVRRLGYSGLADICKEFPEITPAFLQEVLTGDVL